MTTFYLLLKLLGALMRNYVYRYIRLYRDVEADKNILEDDLRKLCEFIRHRSSLSKNVSYYMISYAEKGSIDSLIIVSSDKEDRVVYEAELVLGFIESSLSSISAKLVKKVSNGKQLLIPITRNFSIETMV